MTTLIKGVVPGAARRWPLGRPWPWLMVFLGASALDWLLTRRLVEGGAAYEANPLAAAVLQGHGWLGLAIFKAAITLSVAAIVLVVCRLNRAAALRLLRVVCAITVLVVGYSALLLARAEEPTYLGPILVKERWPARHKMSSAEQVALPFFKAWRTIWR